MADKVAPDTDGTSVSKKSQTSDDTKQNEKTVTPTQTGDKKGDPAQGDSKKSVSSDANDDSKESTTNESNVINDWELLEDFDSKYYMGFEIIIVDDYDAEGKERYLVIRDILNNLIEKRLNSITVPNKYDYNLIMNVLSKTNTITESIKSSIKLKINLSK